MLKIVAITLSTMLSVTSLTNATAEETENSTHFKRIQTVEEEINLLEKLLERAKLLKEQEKPDNYSPWVFELCGSLLKHSYCQQYRKKWKDKNSQTNISKNTQS